LKIPVQDRFRRRQLLLARLDGDGRAGNGALWKNSNSGTSKCGSYTANFHGTFNYEYATATGTVGDVSGSSDPFAQVGQNTQDSNSNTVPSGSCNPFGF
jgi:hypothetical protein